MEFSGQFFRLAEEFFRCGAVLPSARMVCNGEAFLVAVPESRASMAVDDRLAQWAELNRLSGLAMKYVMGHLWPGRSEPKSYFSLVQQFLDAVPRINAMKRSACIEGASL